jgi:hypothetical protein
MMNTWENDHYELPILADATYACPCGGAADMDWFWGGPAYGHHMHYAIRCRMPYCKLHEVGMRVWKNTPAEAIRVWNRRCLEVSDR